MTSSFTVTFHNAEFDLYKDFSGFLNHLLTATSWHDLKVEAAFNPAEAENGKDPNNLVYDPAAFDDFTPGGHFNLKCLERFDHDTYFTKIINVTNPESGQKVDLKLMTNHDLFTDGFYIVPIHHHQKPLHHKSINPVTAGHDTWPHHLIERK